MGLYRTRPLRPGTRRVWDPWQELEELRRAMEEITARAGVVPLPSEMGAFTPDVDLYDTGTAFVARVDLPGVSAEDLILTIEDGVLAVEGHRPAARPEGAADLCCERPAGRFARTLQLPAEVDAEGAHATLRAGVLEIVLPKSRGESLRKVSIEVAFEPAPSPGGIHPTGANSK